MTGKAPENAWKKYRRPGVTEMMPWNDNVDITGVSISSADFHNGSPKAGDMIARNPENHADRWLVNAAYFFANFAPAE